MIRGAPELADLRVGGAKIVIQLRRSTGQQLEGVLPVLDRAGPVAGERSFVAGRVGVIDHVGSD